MSSNGPPRRPTRKEVEIIQRQRAVARQRMLNRQRPPPPPPKPPPPRKSSFSASTSTTSSSTKRSKSTSLSQLLGQEPPNKPKSTSKFLHIPKKTNVIDLTKESSNDANIIDLTRDNTPSPAAPAAAPAAAVKPPPSVKRPTLKRPSKRQKTLHSTDEAAVDAAISAARNRVKHHTTSSSSSGAALEDLERKLPAMPKKTSTAAASSMIGGGGSAAGGRLSHLLNQAGVTKGELKSTQGKSRTSWEEEEDKSGTALDMDDYYKNLREWDFLSDWDRELGGGGGNGSGSGGDDDDDADAADASRTIPDVFSSRRQYQKLWAPLCLSEARAQFLSDASGNLPWRTIPNHGSNHNHHHHHPNGGGGGDGRKGGRGDDSIGPVPVMVKPLMKDVGANVDAMTIMTLPRNGGVATTPSFSSGDFVVLATSESVFVKASKGRLYSDPNAKNSRYSHPAQEGDNGSSILHGVSGHVEFSRRTIDGLKIRISRNKWIKYCRGKKVESMFLLKIGGNVTSMREFSALASVNTFAMLPYLLCRKMTKAKDDMDQLSDVICGAPDSKARRKSQHLKNMGGTAALGEGFANYATKKFNNSQLGAISAAAGEYGSGGFTLVKGPPGTGKTTTLVALLNALHIKQFNQYYTSVKQIVDVKNVKSTGATKLALEEASKQKPRLLVCAPSNNAIDNVIQKIMEGGFIDGSGKRYNPSIVRVGVGQSEVVKDVSLESKVNHLMSDMEDAGKVQSAVTMYRTELGRIQTTIHQTRRRLMALLAACEYPLALEWEIRCDENLQVYFVNHLEQRTTFECPPPPEPGEKFREIKAMPEYKMFMSQLVKMVDRFASISSKVDRYGLVKKAGDSLRLQLETHILNTTHIVLTTLGTAGCLALEASKKFEVVVVDEAAQSVEPATLVPLQLGSSHAILVGDPQQLPATIFSVSGRTTKYDRSLFQRLEEAGHEVHLLDTQYRMHPQISKFPRNIFYGGYLKDGANVKSSSYGNPLLSRLRAKLPAFHPFTVFDLDSSEERGGSSLSNSMEAKFALQLYQKLTKEFGIFVSTTKVSIITPYAQQASLLRRIFTQALGYEYHQSVEINTVDSFQGREANIVIFSCVRAAGSKGIGFLSDVRRMNVALTRAKHFLFVIARCKSICVNPYWDELVKNAKKNKTIVTVPTSFVDSDNSLLTLKTQETGQYPEQSTAS